METPEHDISVIDRVPGELDAAVADVAAAFSAALVPDPAGTPS